MRTAATTLSMLLLAAACGTEADVDTSTARTADDGQALDAHAILNFLNGPDATEFSLVTEVRVQGRAAGSIVQHVHGEDRTLGTGDDDLLQSLEELDALRYVGTATIRTIDAWLRARGYQPSFEVEGVPFTVDEARAVVELANTATQAALDDDVGLDARAARGIVAARPIATIQILAEVSYVSASALQRMKDWVLTHGVTPPPPVDRTPAVMVSAVATDSRHVVVTWTKPIAPSTSAFAFLVFAGSPDNPLGRFSVSFNGVTMTLETDDQVPGTDYTVKADTAVLDIGATPVDPNGRWAHFTGFQPAAPPAPAEVDCTTLQGGTFDGSSFTAADECTAVHFLNQARFSEMARFSDSGRRIAYDCAPDQTCGLRSSRWTRLSLFSDYPGIGATTLTGLRASVNGWTQSGQRWDTVANTWQNRAALAGAPLHFENVAVVGRAADYNTGQYSYACVELRDTTGGANYLRACLQFIGADSAPGCTNDPNACLDPWVGQRASVRGTLRATSAVPGGYVMIIRHDGPGAPNPAAAP